MAPRKQLSIPTTATLPHRHRLHPTSRDVYKTLSRLSRSSLIELAVEWLEDHNLDLCGPYMLTDEEDDGDGGDAPYEPVQSVEELREIYQEFQDRKGTKREIVDRIMEGDWRQGVTLYQHAMAEARFLIDHPSSQRWNTLKLSKRGEKEEAPDEDIMDSKQGHLPRFHAHTFLLNLQRQISSMAKAHYYITRVKDLGVALLRVFILDSPYNTQRSLTEMVVPKSGATEGSKSIFLIFPDGSPFVYVSLASATAQVTGVEGRSLQKIVLEAVPKAFSKPQARYSLQTTSLAAKSLQGLLSLRGSGRSNAAAGGWSIFAEDSFGHSALNYSKPAVKEESPPDIGDEDKENVHPNIMRNKRSLDLPSDQDPKRLRKIAAGRFGVSALETDGRGIDRFDVRIDDPFTNPSELLNQPLGIHSATRTAETTTSSENTQSRGHKSRPSLLDKAAVDDEEERIDDSLQSIIDDEWKPDVRLSFQGSHVFAGIRQLVEQGVVDGVRMPGWMTGEAGVSVGVVKRGKIM
ncbi:CHL4-domain-containing protein, partial [Aulographum hederae CBS 113979]